VRRRPGGPGAEAATQTGPAAFHQNSVGRVRDLVNRARAVMGAEAFGAPAILHDDAEGTGAIEDQGKIGGRAGTWGLGGGFHYLRSVLPEPAHKQLIGQIADFCGGDRLTGEVRE